MLDSTERETTLASDPACWRETRRWLGTTLLEEGWPKVDVNEIEVAFSEACANVHRHAYGGRPDGRLGFRVSIGRDEVVLALDHDGVPFDPSKYRPPDLGRPEEHGYGLYLIRMLVDAVSFERTPVGGRVVLTKRRRPAVPDVATCAGGGHVGT